MQRPYRMLVILRRLRNVRKRAAYPNSGPQPDNSFCNSVIGELKCRFESAVPILINSSCDSFQEPTRASDVICSRCEALFNSTSFTSRPRFDFGEMAEALATLFCSQCGAMLQPVDPEQPMLEKLTQLSRFGLGGDDRPLLARAPEAT